MSVLDKLNTLILYPLLFPPIIYSCAVVVADVVAVAVADVVAVVVAVAVVVVDDVSTVNVVVSKMNMKKVKPE